MATRKRKTRKRILRFKTKKTKYTFTKGSNAGREKMLVYIDKGQKEWLLNVREKTNQSMQNILREALDFSIQNGFQPEIVEPIILVKAAEYREKKREKYRQAKEKLKNGGGEQQP